jgi:hypothetical protein
MYEERTTYCTRCNQERWVGAKCKASKNNEPCIDSEMEKIRENNLKFSKKKDSSSES